MLIGGGRRELAPTSRSLTMFTDITLYALTMQADRARTAARLRLEREARAASALDADSRRAPEWLKRARVALRAAH